MPGQIRFRLRYRMLSTGWFDYLFVTPPEMERLLRGSGWHVQHFISNDDDNLYAAVIDKDPS